MSLAKAFVTGNLVKDPETRPMGNTGKNVCNFSVAVNDGWGDKEHASYLDCTAFGKDADNIAKYFRKGSYIIVDGRLRQESWDKDGEKRSKIIVKVDSWQFGPKQGGRGGQHQNSEPQRGPSREPITNADLYEPPPGDGDNVPF